ncbi:F-box protein family [Rhynchospora pubera]|uniref:F-box protein family n=1 Tax=Rhynchospora pubera TaxID=906938 RepID=A0AAV8F790_9POAL|nr:F-box protein family [Rhynchospora pubera]
MGTASGVKRIENEYSDRLSRLSDELIVSVLSLLPAKEVAQTCILSKRWRNLWAAVPSLCFAMRDWNNDFKKFMGFVCNFLLKRDKTIDTQIFHILCQDCSGIVSSEVNEWITYAVEHNPKILKLSFSDYDGIPDCVFTCKTLESLKLKMKFWKPMDLKPSEIVCLPKLRNLDLEGHLLLH